MSLIHHLNQLCRNTLIENLGIEFTEAGENYLKARMPVDDRTKQPAGILSGGASLALAESIGGAASILITDNEKYNVVGMQIAANHIGQAFSGYVFAHATLLHKGTRTHVWDVLITDEEGKKVSAARITNMIIEKTE
jgi:1,4-dihydroxy-2-naphthoyl-CoA hydrolase